MRHTDVPPRQKTIVTATGAVSTAQDLWAPSPPAFPVRKGVWVVPLIDGKRYMEAVAKEISRATTTIYIAAWDMLLDLRLTREGKVLTLQKLLEDATKRGVAVYVILANTGANAQAIVGPTEMPGTIEDRLQGIGARVLRRSPGRFYRGRSEHQKMIVIDESVAFLGGIDLAIGRWDDPIHALRLHGDPEPYDDDNALIRESGVTDRWSELKESSRQWVDKTSRKIFKRPASDAVGGDGIDPERPRLPWHDTAVTLRGEAVKDVVANFRERWDGSVALQDREAQVLPEFKIGLFKIPELDYTWVEKEKPLPAAQSASATDELIDELPARRCEVQIVRNISPESGAKAHDESTHYAYVHAIKEAQHYVYIENQYFVSEGSTKNSGRSYVVRPEISNSVGRELGRRLQKAIRERTRFRVVIVLPLLGATDSLSRWSPEGGVGVLTRNTLRCIREVAIEALSEQGRDPKDVNQYLLVAMLRAADVLRISSTKDNGDLRAIATTEQVYVHSKLLIVDDRFVCIGSSNVNDRGMSATSGDSELNMSIKDESAPRQQLGGDGRLRPVRPFARRLRQALWREHFGRWLAEDPIEAFDEILPRVRARTVTLEAMFPNIERVDSPSWAPFDLEGLAAPHAKKMDRSSSDLIASRLRGLKNHGLAVLYPLYVNMEKELDLLQNRVWLRRMQWSK